MTNLVGADLWRLPVGMQQREQWCISGPDKAPYLVGPNGLYHASPVQGPWLGFDAACKYAAENGCGIGYILTENDPYTCIDLDVKDADSIDLKTGLPYPKELWTSNLSLEFYSGIVQFAQSYTELSASGKGLHVWVLGDIGAGRRGKGIEVYSKQRFIVCTGLVVSEVKYVTLNGVAIPQIIQTHQHPINDGSLILQSLEQELTVAQETIELTEVEKTITDEEIWKRALNATNSDKFRSLCAGNWIQLGFPSQSEADLALLSMFTFYSKSNNQCRRLFRQTALGAREKANKNDVYLNRTLQLVRARQEKAQISVAHGESMAEALLANKRNRPKTDAQTTQVDPVVQAYVRDLDQTLYTKAEPNQVDFIPPETNGLPWPPGLVGAIANFIYQSAPRPVKEVAIVSALGLMAGVTGKAYNIGQTGLNLYIILIARSGIGKEAMHSGIGHIMRAQCGQSLSNFVDFADYVSGPALTKAMESWASIVNVGGEWGRKLKRMGDERDSSMQQLRTVMTNLYQKSGSASIAGGLGYSNREQNVASVNGVSYSMIGETTPGTFYESLTPSMMEDGFLSRFNVIEYLGERPAENKNQVMRLPDQLSDALTNIASHCMDVVMRPNVSAIQIQINDDAKKLLEEFNLRCDENIRKGGTDESLRQIWNRAHLKALRVAGVLAAADNHITPVLTLAHAQWGIDLVTKDTDSMLAKVMGGDIGTDDAARFSKLQYIAEEYLTGRGGNAEKQHPTMVTDGIITRRYLQVKTKQIKSFSNYRLGAALALDHTIKVAIDSGYFMEVNKDKAIEAYGFHGRCFRVLHLDI